MNNSVAFKRSRYTSIELLSVLNRMICDYQINKFNLTYREKYVIHYRYTRIYDKLDLAHKFLVRDRVCSHLDYTDGIIALYARMSFYNY